MSWCKSVFQVKQLLVLCITLVLSNGLFSQQVADTTYNPNINSPEYKTGQGPVIFIDEGHFNFHTKDGRYTAFSRLLERDGYVVKAYKGIVDKHRLSEGKILVIANALNEVNVGNWSLPTPSAFTPDEIEEIRTWVETGGSLFLIADHMPMAGAAEALAKAFDFKFTNGFVMDTVSRGPAVFNVKEKTLIKSPIVTGRNTSESVEQVVSFTGQAIEIPDDATSILKLSANYINMLPERAWQFDENTTSYGVEGWSQGAYKTYCKGKIVVFGEAAMFTAQLAGAQKMKVGMNHPAAPENYQLLLNIIHWLDGRLE